MCAGTYLDEEFRDAVIEELYVHEERLAAPSLGHNAARVLAHALRARRIETAWAGAILLLWVVAVPLTSGLILAFLPPVLILAVASFVRGRADRPPWYRRVTAFVLRWYARLSLLLVGVLLLVAALAGEETGPLGSGSGSGTGFGSGFGSGPSSDVTYDGPGSPLALIPDALMGWATGARPFHAWIALALPLVLACAVGAQRGQFARALTGELSRTRFPDVMADPAERAEGARFQRLRQRIRTEQHGPMVMYAPANPFCGAGVPYEPWSLSVELRPRKGRRPEPMDNSAVLARIIPLVEALRVPAPHGSPQAAAAVRDRLRGLEIDQCVFLPVDGLPRRADAPYEPEAFEAHRARAVEEGGETRRHFLRIRVGGWGEGIVTTVFVRVHTQGGMFMLEVAPHVLLPLRPLFRNADRIAHRYRNNHPFGKAVWVLTRMPGSAGRALLTLWRGFVSVWRMATGGHGGALPDGPAVSVRELAMARGASLFQDMDVSRYLKSIQDRVAGGVRLALHEAGWQTEEFEQRIVNVSNGGTFIETAHGAVGIGDHNIITNHQAGHDGRTNRTGRPGGAAGRGGESPDTGGNRDRS
nr:hypothetical protein [Streptomyces sp. MST-110588]